MAKSRTLTIEEVSQLGAEQLAQLLLAAAEDDTALMRRLRIAVASRNGAAEVAAEIDVEIKRIKRGKASIDWQRAHAFARDLTTLREAIEGPLADADPVMALESMFDFIDLAPSVLERSENSDGIIGDLFDGACDAAALLAAQAAPALAPERAAFRAYQTYLCDEYGIADGIVASFARILDEVSPAALRSWIETDLARLPPPADPTSAAERLPEWKLVHALAEVADAAGDVDAYCAAQHRLGPRIRDDAGMAKRLLDAGRAAEAYTVIEKAEPNLAKNAIELADLRIAALSALGRRDEAQAARWEEFARTLREQPLRDLLKHLPDFEDTEKEREALAFAANFRDPHRALEFLTTWPDPRGAAALVQRRVDAIDGNRY
jgi:Trp operon repressor